jgi:E3 ubiquitin-protein ligase DOA10
MVEQHLFVFDESPTNKRKGSVSIPYECRICLEEEPEGASPTFISPCLCSGSVKYVHFSCLSTWIEKNSPNSLPRHSETGQFECEMCKHKI